MARQAKVFSLSAPPDVQAHLLRVKERSAYLVGLIRDDMKRRALGGGSEMDGSVAVQELTCKIGEMENILLTVLESQRDNQGATVTLVEQVTHLVALQERHPPASVEEEKKAATLDETIRAAFPEMESGGIEGWREDMTRAEISGYSVVRAGLIATRMKISEAEAKAAILRIYPDLEGYL